MIQRAGLPLLAYRRLNKPHSVALQNWPAIKTLDSEGAELLSVLDIGSLRDYVGTW